MRKQLQRWLQVAGKVKETVAAAQEHMGAPDSHSATTAAGMENSLSTFEDMTQLL